MNHHASLKRAQKILAMCRDVDIMAPGFLGSKISQARVDRADVDFQSTPNPGPSLDRRHQCVGRRGPCDELRA